LLERWIPWKFLAKRILHSYGFPDPFILLTKLYQFSEPSEVQTPIELLRAGIAFHTRGLINTKIIQNNLDWVWPFWVEKQFNPADASFMPRAYSLTHVNLTHRNWTAVGQPDLPLYPLVAPRGLVTPLYDGWSIDFWIYRDPEQWLLPSRSTHVDQTLEFDPELAVHTRSRGPAMELISRVWMENHDSPTAVVHVRGTSERRAYLAVSLRPYNPEGIQFIEAIAYDAKDRVWLVNKKTQVRMSDAPEKVLFSNYTHGDVIHRFMEDQSKTGIECRVGMATSSALFSLEENLPRELQLRIPLDEEFKGHPPPAKSSSSTWRTVLEESAQLQIPDERISFLYQAAARTLVLLSAGDIVPGPYTYRRFWFRDACLMINAMLSLGLKERVFRLLNSFISRQQRSGYFRSQEGEWDSNGQVLWIFDRYLQLTGNELPEQWAAATFKGARWIVRKRIPKGGGEHGGLLPPGFSAEHLGPNDYYYWDDFWGLAGLKAAARIAGQGGMPERERAFLREAEDFEKTILDSIDRIPERRKQGAIPASPHRRMDSGAVGSLVADYPLQITAVGDAAVAMTVEFLMSRCFYAGGFFQDMIHSGINAYLTLCIAQTLLRNGDARHRDLVESVAGLASSTGQWPEAIHPKTGGGCMGDGQHGWAAAEWIQIIRNSFIREEGDSLIIGSGIFPRWMHASAELIFGPTPTPFGDVGISISTKESPPSVKIDAAWRGKAPRVEIRIPGFRPMRVERFTEPIVLDVQYPEEF
jgi:hypothetical protein